MDRMGKKDLISIVEKQKQQIERYETKLRDVVIAYKGLSKEKEALEASLKAISSSKASVIQPQVDENAAPEKENCTVASDSAKAESSSNSEDVESVDQLKVQLQTLTDSLATLSAEKSRMEARFQADKKQLRHERDERDKTIKDLEEKVQNLTKQHLFEMECVKSRLIVERHERDKERNDHAVMMRELQMLLSEERRTKEQMENQVEELKSKSVISDSNANQKELFEKRIRELQNELESVRKKLKKSEAKAKETPPALLELQEQMANMKSQHHITILQEQKKTIDAEERAKRTAAVHEERVASLETRLAELSSAVGKYDRQLQQDQVAIQKLKDQLVELNFDPTASTACEENQIVANTAEMKVKEMEGTNDVQSIVDKIFYLKGLLEEASKHSEKTVDFSVLWNHVSGFPIDTAGQHRPCKDEYNLLKQEFELYKLQNQRQVPANLRNEDTELEISSLKSQIKSLKERIRILNTQLEDVEKEYKEEVDHLEKLLKAERANCKAAVASCEAEFRARLSLLEQQLQKQRERTLALLEEKDQEIQVLKSSFQSLLPRKTSSRDGRSWTLPSGDQVQDAETVLANLGNTSDSPHVLHYAHELARRDVEISSLRRERHQLEAALRELRRLSATDREKQADEVQSLQEEIDRLNRCQSREGANLEYLKNVVLCFLMTNDSSSKKHMLNAIAAVLKFSDLEQEKLNYIHKHL